MNLDGTRRAADHRLRRDELGAVHPSVRPVRALRVEQARVRELRGVHGRHRRQEGAGARHLLRRLRWSAGALAGRHAAGVDVEPRRRPRGTDLSSPSGTIRMRSRRCEPHRRRRRRNDPDDRRSAPMFVRACSSLSPRVFRRRPPRRRHRAASTRAYVETLASDRFAGREAGSTGERLAGDYIAAQLARIGARPLPGRSDMFVPFDFTAGSRDGGSRRGRRARTDASPHADGRHRALLLRRWRA